VIVFFDYEDDRATFKFRLKALGVTSTEARRVAYWRLSESLMLGSEGGLRWLGWVDEHRPTFVGLDSVSKACAAASLDDERNPEFRRWDNGVIGPLDHRGITTCRIDHTGHDDGPGGPKTRARGASAKKDSVTGVSYLFRANTRWTKFQDGDATITPIKCRCGDMEEDVPVAVMRVSVHDEGAKLDISFEAPGDTHAHTETFRPTALMERVSRYLETHAAAGPASKNTIEKDVSGNATYVRQALAVLIAEGYVDVEKAGRGLMHTLIKPYRETGDPLDEHSWERGQA